MDCPTLDIDGLVYRPKGSDKVYLAKAGHLHWIPDPETFKALGYTADQVLELPPECFRVYVHGVPIRSIRSTEGGVPTLGLEAAFGQGTPAASVPVSSGQPHRPTLYGADQGIANTGSVVQYAQSTVAKYKTPLLVAGGLWVAWKIGLFRRIL